MNLDGMVATAHELVAEGKGVLAADESTPTMAKRLVAIGLESTEPLRRTYREILFTTDGLSEHISGVILFDETVRQSDEEGTPFPEVLRRRGIIPGIKVDGGTRPLAAFPGEVATEGLDGLRERLTEYAGLGLRFAKWRAVIHIGAGLPTATCVETHAHALARYAALAQEAGLVPIVEPEVLMDGSHDIDVCADVTERVLREVYAQLARHRVCLEASLLKPNMVLPGADSGSDVSDQRIAAATLDTLRQAVPVAVPGMVFLSGGQSDEQATARLDALNRAGTQPWQLSFSFGRALQAPVLRAWAGQEENRSAAQAALLKRARLNGAARLGAYSADLEDREPEPARSPEPTPHVKGGALHAAAGDRIVIRSHTTDGPVRDAEVLEVQHADGSPPYLVRWSDTGHEGLFFPGPDAYIDHEGPSVPDRDLAWRAE